MKCGSVSNDPCTLTLLPGLVSYRREYVDLYIDYVFNKAADMQYEAFSSGFLKVCGGRVLVSHSTTYCNTTFTNTQSVCQTDEAYLILISFEYVLPFSTLLEHTFTTKISLQNLTSNTEVIVWYIPLKINLMGSSVVIHKHWSCSQSMDVKVRDTNSFPDVPLISWPIKIDLNRVQIQLAIM